VLQLYLRYFVLDEAVKVLHHYCALHSIVCRPGTKTENSIKKSLRLYGLALTARYIHNAVWFSRKQSNEAGYNNHRAFSQVYGNLNFWIDDPRARTYTAHPFIRKDGFFSESDTVALFSKFFLEPHNLNYLNSPITSTELDRDSQES